MTTLEKMARAIYQREWEGQPYPGPFHTAKDYWMEFARAALEALREPSEGMMHAAEHTPAMQFVVTALMQAKNHGMGELPEDSRIVGDVWATMIDTILEEDNDN